MDGSTGGAQTGEACSHEFHSKNTETPGFPGVSVNGAGEETRTLDVHLGKVVLYQLSYARETKTGCDK